MKSLRILSAAEQVALHLRGEMLSGSLAGEMPGAVALADGLGVNHKTVEAALSMLERDGLLAGQGPRKRKRIIDAVNNPTGRALRIAIFAYERSDKATEFMVEVRYRLTEAGHSPFFTGKSMTELGMDAGRIATYVEANPADAWVVVAASRPVLEWFAAQQVPVFAMFGFMRTLGIAGTGPDKSQAYREAVRELVELGHRRIVLLARPQRIVPRPGAYERKFLAALESAGISTSAYNLPVWENSREGFHRHLDIMFRLTPPSALIIQESLLFFAVRQFLSKHRMRVPQEVSLICADPDPNFAWQDPSIAHIHWDSAPWVRRVTGWAANISRGKKDKRQIYSKASFVPGGTMGSARKGGIKD